MEIKKRDECATRSAEISIGADGTASPEELTVGPGAHITITTQATAIVRFDGGRLFGLHEFRIAPGQEQHLQALASAPMMSYFYEVYTLTHPTADETGNPCIIVDGPE